MSTGDQQSITLVDDTRLNVASLLLEPVGSTRGLDISLSALKLDDDLVARNITADATLTRLRAHILMAARMQATVRLECATCLTEYEQPFAASFREQFRQTVDVRTGSDMADLARDEAGEADEGEPGFSIDENHALDVGEALRQWIVLSIPIKPGCGPDCPGPLLHSTGGEDEVDDRFAGLARLLDEESNRA